MTAFIQRLTAATLLSVAAAACGSSSPAAPSLPDASDVITLSGSVTATTDGASLGGVQIAIAGTGTTALARADGTFTLQVPALGVRRLDITGDNILARTVWSSGANATIDAIRLGPGTLFDLPYYRQIIRDSLTDAESLEPLRRWARNMNLYIRTVDEANQPVPQNVIDFASNIIAQTVPMWTDNRLSIATVEQGTETRAGVAGWLTVIWPNPRDEGVCGRATVGTEGGRISLNYLASSNCGCNGQPVRALTIRHEVGHSMGFWHTDRSDDLMFGSGLAGCDRLPSARERQVAAIAYKRPLGNTDPDNDPASSPTTRVRPTNVLIP